MHEPGQLPRVEAQFRLRVGNRTLEATLNLPAEPISVEELLPALYAFADAYLEAVRIQARESGLQISCRPGCGACCAQLVPLSEAEALRLARLVQQMPAPRRDQILGRFRLLRQRLEDAGLWERLRDTEALPDLEVRRRIGIEYFSLGVPCPFLENQSCSIYPDRPMRCREYFVTSPAVHCADPSPETVKVLPLPVKFSEVLYCFGDGRGFENTRWVPLSHLFDWMERNETRQPVLLPAVEMFRNFLVQIAPPRRPAA